MAIKVFDSESALGYKQITTAFMDFGIAEVYGEKAIRETYLALFNNFKNDYRYLTELVMVLNWKMWQHYEDKNEAMSKLYQELWEVADLYACENLKGAELDYFYHTTD